MLFYVLNLNDIGFYALFDKDMKIDLCEKLKNTLKHVMRYTLSHTHFYEYIFNTLCYFFVKIIFSSISKEHFYIKNVKK